MSWPLLLDFTNNECERKLRSLELEAYSSVVSALRAQGDLDKIKKQYLQETANIFNISPERYRAEIRRAANDERLATICDSVYGINTSMEWAIEGRRLAPLITRAPPLTAFTEIANKIANLTAQRNASLPEPEDTAMSPEPAEIEEADEPIESSQTVLPRPISPVTQIHSHHVHKNLPIPVDDEVRRKRHSSIPIEIPGTPYMSAGPPPTKITALTPTSIHTLQRPIPVTKLSSAPVRCAVSSSMVSPSQKVIIMSSNNPNNVTTPSLLQRSLSVPIVKTTVSSSTTTINTKPIPMATKSTVQMTSNLAPTTAYLPSGARIRPKSIPTPTPQPPTTTMLPRGRAGSIVIPISSPNTPGGLQLKSKPQVQIKQEGTGMKIIATTPPKLMPKPSTVAASGNRLVTFTATTRASTLTTQTQPTTSAGTPTSNNPLLAAAHGKANVIVVKKGTTLPISSAVKLSTAGRGTESINKIVLRKPITQTIGATRQGNVIVVDLNQEQLKGNTMLTEILHASGILGTSKSSSSGPPQLVPQSNIIRTNTVDDSQDDSQDDPLSPSSSTDTGSSNDTPNPSDDKVKRFSPLPSTSSPLVNTTACIQQFTKKFQPTPKGLIKLITTSSSSSSGPTTPILTTAKTFKLVTVDPVKKPMPSLKPVTTMKNETVSSSSSIGGRKSPDMIKIEKEMMSLCEGTTEDEEDDDEEVKDSILARSLLGGAEAYKRVVRELCHDDSSCEIITAETSQASTIEDNTPNVNIQEESMSSTTTNSSVFFTSNNPIITISDDNSVKAPDVIFDTDDDTFTEEIKESNQEVLEEVLAEISDNSLQHEISLQSDINLSNEEIIIEEERVEIENTTTTDSIINLGSPISSDIIEIINTDD